MVGYKFKVNIPVMQDLNYRVEPSGSDPLTRCHTENIFIDPTAEYFYSNLELAEDISESFLLARISRSLGMQASKLGYNK